MLAPNQSHFYYKADFWRLIYFFSEEKEESKLFKISPLGPWIGRGSSNSMPSNHRAGLLDRNENHVATEFHGGEGAVLLQNFGFI